MTGQQQAQASFNQRNQSNQQSSGTAQITAQQHATQAQGQTDTERRDVAVVAVLGYN